MSRVPKSPAARFAEGAARLWGRALELPALWLVLFLALATWALMPVSLFHTIEAEEGTIASRDYLAPRDVPVEDRETTQQKREKAREEVLPVYDLDSAAVEQKDAQAEILFRRGRELLAGAPEELRGTPELLREMLAVLQGELQGSGGSEGLRVSEDALSLLAARGFSPELEDRVRGTFSEILRRGVVGNKARLLDNRVRGVNLHDLRTGTERVEVDLFDYLGYPEEVREFLSSEVRRWSGLSAAQRRQLGDWMLANISPNLNYNSSDTLKRREEAAAAAEPVYHQIRKGQAIVRKGDEITAAQARLIAEVFGEHRPGRRLLPLLGTSLLLLVTAFVLWLGLKGEKVSDHSRERLFGEALLVLLLSVLSTKFSFVLASALADRFAAPPFNSVESYLHAVPFASLALVAALLFGRGTSLLLSFLYVLLVGQLAGGEAMAAVLYAIGGSLAAVFALDLFPPKQRLALARVGLLVGLVNIVVLLILTSLSNGAEGGVLRLGFDVLCALAGGLLVAVVASFAVPVLEWMLGITTDIKLIELANTNLPLLRRLAFDAPGTFQHSLMVANLAKEGCDAIGADSVLAYTGALYHDVGKIFRPEYFIENQRPGHNRHDKLSPSMSALILINHVKEGLKLARRHGLPQPIQEAIACHHGTHLIKFFYKRAQEQCAPEGGEVRETDYRYPGPRPASKVMGVLMLADGVEAASRTLNDPRPEKVRGLVRQILDDRLRDGQLDRTDLTLADLNQITDAFVRVLTTIFHRRVDYPGFDFNRDARESRGPAAAAVAKAS